MVKITVYKITGWQLLFKVPESYCEECDLLVAAANTVAKKLSKKGVKVQVVVRPYTNYFLPAILKGIWHPPGIVVDGKLISQGVVPPQADIEAAVMEAVKKNK